MLWGNASIPSFWDHGMPGCGSCGSELPSVGKGGTTPGQTGSLSHVFHPQYELSIHC